MQHIMQLSEDAKPGPYQFTLYQGATGAALKEAGLDQVESDAHFLDVMRTHAKIISDTYGRVTSDSLRTVAANMGLEPRSSNSWGVILRGKHWKVIGMEPSTLPSNHGRMIRVYVYQEEEHV